MCFICFICFYCVFYAFIAFAILLLLMWNQILGWGTLNPYTYIVNIFQFPFRFYVFVYCLICVCLLCVLCFAVQLLFISFVSSVFLFLFVLIFFACCASFAVNWCAIYYLFLLFGVCSFSYLCCLSLLAVLLSAILYFLCMEFVYFRSLSFVVLVFFA